MQIREIFNEKSSRNYKYVISIFWHGIVSIPPQIRHVSQVTQIIQLLKTI